MTDDARDEVVAELRKPGTRLDGLESRLSRIGRIVATKDNAFTAVIAAQGVSYAGDAFIVLIPNAAGAFD
ncbi:MAG: hypothetical protein ACFBWO_09795 [Paracoccaceae bacterium]